MLKQTNPLLLIISFIFFLLPIATLSKLFLLSDVSQQYAVIFDAGSTGSRVHVFRFDHDFNLLKIGDGLEFFNETKPGLSDYENDPQAGALSLLPLLKEAENVVPQELRAQTPVRLGATAGLRMLEGDAAERILEAVRDFLKSESSLQYRADWVAVLDGYHEGAYLWVTVNYLLSTLGENYSDTVATVDLGGGSVQMAYAISKEAANNAPITSDEEDPYVQDMYLGGKDYSVYAHSYLNYGYKAARAGILAFSKNSSNPCVTTGYEGTFEYDGVFYKVKADPSGASLKKCRKLATKLLDLKAPCKYQNCAFNGAWSGGGGDGQKNIYVASSFHFLAVEVGIIDSNAAAAIIRPVDYLNAAKLACITRAENINSTFPHVEDEDDIPFLCMDLIYQYTLLVEGFGLHPLKKITAVDSIEYQNISVEVAWPLGCAIDTVSSADKLAYYQRISLISTGGSSI